MSATTLPTAVYDPASQSPDLDASRAAWLQYESVLPEILTMIELFPGRHPAGLSAAYVVAIADDTAPDLTDALRAQSSDFSTGVDLTLDDGKRLYIRAGSRESTLRAFVAYPATREWLEGKTAPPGSVEVASVAGAKVAYCRLDLAPTDASQVA